MKLSKKGSAFEVSDGVMTVLTATLPKDISLLNILANNAVGQGDVFLEDGWVYDPDGRRLRRWHVIMGLSRVRVWPPHLREIARIEKLWWRTRQAAIDSGDKLTALGKSLPLGEYQQDVRPWISLRVEERGIWSGTPRSSNLLQCPELVRAWERNRDSWLRCGRVRAILNLAFESKFSAEVLEPGLFEVLVNGRKYLYQSALSRFDALYFKQIAGPEDAISTLVIES